MGSEDANIIRPLKGTSAIGFDDARFKADIVSTIRTVASNYGYDEMSTPIIYERELLAYKFSDGAELVDEIYSVTDRGERDLGLRYDLTIPFARFVAENAKSLAYPFKRFEVGEVFRDGPVKSGRTRQFTQCDVDVVGDPDPIVTAYEQMSMMAMVFDRLGLGDAKIRYSSRKLAEGLVSYAGVRKDSMSDVIRVMDKKDKLSPDDFELEMTEAGFPREGSRISLGKFMELLALDADGLAELREEIEEKRNERYAVLDGLGFDDAFYEWREGMDLLASGIEEVEALSKLINDDESMRDRCALDLSIVRGQDYYTGIMFEAFAPGFRSSIAGGGRYETIIGSLADSKNEESYSASGVSFGIVPIMHLVRERMEANGNKEDENMRRGCVLIACSDADVPSALRLANRARSNKCVEVDATNRSVSKKMQAANKARYAYSIVYGEEERESGRLNLKNMENRESISISEKCFVEADEKMLGLFTHLED